MNIYKDKKNISVNDINEIKNFILQGKSISKHDALSLLTKGSQKVLSCGQGSENIFLETLCQAAKEICFQFCGNSFDLCAVINGKSGKCSENCKFCAQSSSYDAIIREYPLMSQYQIIQHLQTAQNAGVQSCALVNAGRRASKQELKTMASAFYIFTQASKNKEKNGETYKQHEKRSMNVCASLGLLNIQDFQILKENGVTRVHNNLESSKTYFPNICTSHSFDDKVESIKAAQKCGLMVCSGGIFGLGESLQDRIDMAFSLKDLGISSVPMNILFPIKGTPFENNKPLCHEEIRALVAVYRFILPNAFLRLAGGRTLLEDKGRSLFEGGANAMISGNMLTISGFNVVDDLSMIQELGFSLA